LGEYQRIMGDDLALIEQKAISRMQKWDKSWEGKQKAYSKQEKSALAALRTQEAESAQALLSRILAHTLRVNDSIDWAKLMRVDEYPVTRPVMPSTGKAPDNTDMRYQPQLSLMDKLSSSRKAEKTNAATARYQADLAEWTQAKERVEAQYAMELSKWEREQEAFVQKRTEFNATIAAKRDRYLSGDPDVCVDYFDMVLSRSDYPDYFPQTFELDLNPATKTLVVDYQLPSLTLLPKVKDVKYNQSRDEFTETQISATQLNKLYDDVLYQVALRTIHEIFEADQIEAVELVVFNGYVDATDPSTGQQKTACILSVQASKQEFEAINLAKVDPRACFKSLKGVGSAKLYSLTPIAPLLIIDREDKRFVESYAVAGDLDDTVNLAAMDWEDFEHLVREVFEKEFASSGGEVRVTQASRDGGIDAVAFDPDPIRGGKIVIQAKRYTNTVSVSAVRDLYGSVMNEGATKGILVTTADYGPDAYEFARGKPLTLLTGSNLLHLLEKHGHRAKIDLREAKRLMAEGK
jgi:restriction system protein